MIKSNGEKAIDNVKMKRSEVIADQLHGIAEYNGETYVLLQDAYPDYTDGVYPRYSAVAVRERLVVNSDDEVPVYLLHWDVLPEYVDFDAGKWNWREDITDDESQYCDWNIADEMEETGLMVDENLVIA